MTEKIKKFVRQGDSEIYLVFSDNCAMSVIELLIKFSPYFLGEMVRNFDTLQFESRIKFDDSKICDIFCRFYLEK